MAYNWGDSAVQPGDSPTDSVADPVHRAFIENSLRWLHCTQLRWISDYDDGNPAARAGAEKLQRAMGYRFVLDRVSLTPNVSEGTLRVDATVTNEGSAPFYYHWPVQLSLHDPATRNVVWSATLNDVDIRRWAPGRNWTAPQWQASGQWPGWVVVEGWSSMPSQWSSPPKGNRVTANVKLDVPNGEYVLSIAVLDPASQQPSLRFATANYWNGGWHPLARIAVGQAGGGPLPAGTAFDDPGTDLSLSY